MADQGLRDEFDIAAANWVAPRLGEPGSVAGTVPAGFEAYVRVCHPVHRGDRLYTWPEVAKETGRTAHPLMQWHALVGASDYLNMTDSVWPGGDPRRGSLDASVLSGLCAVLAEHTETPQAWVLGVWHGWGFIDGGGRRMTAYPIGSGRVGGEERIEPAFSRDQPTLPLSHREYFLFRGSVAGAMEMTTQWRQSPNLFWPEDRAWFVASEIDFDSTVIGGSAELARAVLQAPGLDAWPVGPGDLLTAFADDINSV